MATVQEVKQRARELIAELLPDAFPEKIEDDTVLSAEGNVDSMGFILILTKLEGEFNAYVPDETWGDLRTLDDVAHAIVENVRPADEAAGATGVACGDAVPAGATETGAAAGAGGEAARPVAARTYAGSATASGDSAR